MTNQLITLNPTSTLIWISIENHIFDGNDDYIKDYQMRYMISNTQRNQIIEYYLQGLSRDEIALNSRVSAGSVSNTIQNWKNSIDSHDIEEIRQFIKTSKKEGMTIKQCSEGYRMLKLMDKLGIVEIKDIDSHENRFLTFVNEFYSICQMHQITTNILISWFNDIGGIFHTKLER